MNQRFTIITVGLVSTPRYKRGEKADEGPFDWIYVYRYIMLYALCIVFASGVGAVTTFHWSEYIRARDPTRMY